MEKIRFQSERWNRRGGRSSTKLYAPARDNEAYAYDPETGERLKDAPLRAAPVELRPRSELRLAARVGIMFCVFVFAGMLVFILSGYERIARAYAGINTLNDEIDEIRLHINALEADIECAVTIEDAQSYAISQGMQYPVQSQYLESGKPIPNTAASGPSGQAPEDGTPEDGGVGDDTP